MTATTTVPRRIDCAGVFNLRDLGGYRTHDGRNVRWRTLFRADGLHRGGVVVPDQLCALGWRTVIDLRTSTEVDGGQFRSSGVDVVHLPMLRETWDVASVVADTDDPVDFLAARYIEMTEQGATAIAAAFEILGAPTRLPAVFHCSAGKDRTGVLAALVLSSLGIDDEQIADDYHLSAPAMGSLVEWITTHRPEVAEHMARQATAFLSCPREAIGRFLDSLRERHGSVHGYLAAIGVDDGALAAVRDNLLEG